MKRRLSRKKFTVPERLCPYCGHLYDRVGLGSDDTAPTPNWDIIVCVKCGGVCMLTSALLLRKITEDEMAEFIAEASPEEIKDLQGRRSVIDFVNRVRSDNAKTN
jgi:hypothetical protein